MFGLATHRSYLIFDSSKMTSQIQYYIRKIKQRYIFLAERNKIHYQLGKLIEQGEYVPISVKARRGACRTYNYYKGFEQETT